MYLPTLYVQHSSMIVLLCVFYVTWIFPIELSTHIYRCMKVCSSRIDTISFYLQCDRGTYLFVVKRKDWATTFYLWFFYLVNLIYWTEWFLDPIKPNLNKFQWFFRRLQYYTNYIFVVENKYHVSVNCLQPECSAKKYNPQCHAVGHIG